MRKRIHQIAAGARRTLREEGAASFVRRFGRWLSGERRYHGTPDFATTPEAHALAAACLAWGAAALETPPPKAARSARKAPRISVLVRTRNRPHLLPHALTSLANQTRGDFEVVIINDGGEDVAPLLAAFEAYFPIQYVQYDGTLHSPSAATNAALAVMRGDYFIHLDDDDIVYPHHLAAFEQMIAHVPDARVLVSNHARALLDGENRVLELLPMPPRPFEARVLRYANFITIHAALFHRAIYDAIGGYDPALPRLADWDYLIRASQQAAFAAVPETTCEYRFYLNTAAAHLDNRAPTLQALRQIYGRYPAADRLTRARRADAVRGLETQIAQAQAWRDAVAAGRMTREEMQRAILRVVGGFSGAAH